MRLESAAQAKGKRGAPCNMAPREGTKIRALYDLLMANKGIPLDVPLTKLTGHNADDGRRIDFLRDFYGLDIRKLAYGRWVLAGEWIGTVYVDYIADHLAKLEREARQ